MLDQQYVATGQQSCTGYRNRCRTGKSHHWLRIEPKRTMAGRDPAQRPERRGVTHHDPGADRKNGAVGPEP